MVKKRVNRFSKEFKRTLATAIAAAFGFITALAWRDVINEYLVNRVSSLSPIQGKLISAVLITILAVIVIMWSSKLNPKK